MTTVMDQPTFRIGDRVIDRANKHSVVIVHEERTVPSVPGSGGRDDAQLVRVAGSCTW